MNPETPNHGFGSVVGAVRFNPDRAVVVRVASHGPVRVFAVCLEPHQELPAHSTPGDLTLFVVEARPRSPGPGPAITPPKATS